MGLGNAIAKWAAGSIAGKVAKDGGPIRGVGEACARKFESDPETPTFVRERLFSERIGRDIGRGIRSASKEKGE